MLDIMYIPYASRKVGGWHVGICRRFTLQRLKLQLMKGPLITLRMKGLMIPPFQREGADDPAAPVLLACFPMNPLRCWSGEDEFAALIPAQS